MSCYDRAEEYDILFGWDPGPERDFVLGASERYGLGKPRRVLEPFCGTGRLLRAMPCEAVGFDENPHMLRRAAGRGRVFRADAARFAARPESFDLAYCLVDSFRHLVHAEDAAAHLRAVSRALKPGAVYVLGLELTGDEPAAASRDEWSMERGRFRVRGAVESLGDGGPVETVRISLDITRDSTRERVDSFHPMRVYGRRELRVVTGGSFEVAAAFDRRYDLDEPRALDEVSGSVALVLRRSA